MDCKHPSDGNELIRSIGEHSERVKNHVADCSTTVCRHCGLDTADGQNDFVFHGSRARRFLIVVGLYVYKVTGFLARWRCPRCHRTFTDYPPFAHPYKAYAKPQMIERIMNYVCKDSATYRGEVRSANLPIFYAQTKTKSLGQQDDFDPDLAIPVVAHTTLFRWISALAADACWKTATINADRTVASRKFTSTRRRAVLIACRANCLRLCSAREITSPSRG